MNEKQLRRILKDFPWLWAIRQKWDFTNPNKECKVQKTSTGQISIKDLINATPLEMLIKLVRFDEHSSHIWIKTKNNGKEAVHSLKPGLDIGNALTYLWHKGIQVEFIVVHIKDEVNPDEIDLLTIYRPPNGKSFNPFLPKVLGDTEYFTALRIRKSVEEAGDHIKQISKLARSLLGK